MLIFKDLDYEKWNQFSGIILNSENIYPEQIRTPGEEYLNIFAEGGCIAKIAMSGADYIGNAIGYVLKKDELSFHSIDFDVEEGSAVYLFNFVVNPEHQGKGYGKNLLSDFLETAKQRGYKRVFGHFRKNGSLYLAKKFGAVELKSEFNWCDTGEEYILCEIKL